MVDVRGDVLRPPHGTTPAAVKSNIKSEMRSFKSNENIHKKEGGSYYVVSANKAETNEHNRLSRYFCWWLLFEDIIHSVINFSTVLW